MYTPEELGLPAGLEPIQVFREAGPVGGSLYVAVRKPAGQNLVLSGRDEMNGKLYPMRFSDGIYYIAITDNSRAREDMLNRGMAGVMATVVLVAVLFWYTSRLTRRIIRLSHETAAVGAGDLDADITVDGRDEIAGLASDIDGMRDAIIERMGNEKRAWEANSELITAMSHDIRTPMTSLLGYLGLLNNGRPLPEDEQKRYLEAAYGKSLALKELTDELFKYFLVFGHSDVELHREVFDAHLLLMQLLGEAQFDLQDAGYGVQNIDQARAGQPGFEHQKVRRPRDARRLPDRKEGRGRDRDRVERGFGQARRDRKHQNRPAHLRKDPLGPRGDLLHQPGRGALRRGVHAPGQTGIKRIKNTGRGIGTS